MNRLVNVSNRVSVKGTATHGGLTVALLAAMRRSGGMWFGWNGDIASEESRAPEVIVRDGVSYATIPLPQNLYENYYCGFANGTLWPLFHYFLAGFVTRIASTPPMNMLTRCSPGPCCHYWRRRI